MCVNISQCLEDIDQFINVDNGISLTRHHPFKYNSISLSISIWYINLRLHNSSGIYHSPNLIILFSNMFLINQSNQPVQTPIISDLNALLLRRATQSAFYLPPYPIQQYLCTLTIRSIRYSTRHCLPPKRSDTRFKIWDSFADNSLDWSYQGISYEIYENFLQ